MKMILCFLVISFVSSLHLSGVWTDIRNSSFTADNEIFFQYESQMDEYSQHLISYYQNEQWTSNQVENYSGSTYQSVIPFSNTENIALSFRIENDLDIHLIPGFTSYQPDDLTELTTMSEYVRDINIPAHLNIAGEKMLFSDERLYFALNNFGGGFPVSDGLFGPFYSYTINLWPTVEGDPDYVYTLLFTVNLPPYVNSGLFKIDALTEDMTQIGSVVTQVDQNSNTLFISCLLSDLINDADFATSYSSDNSLTVSSLTQKIENFGTVITIMDEGTYHNVYLRQYVLEPFINTIPQVDNVQYNITEDTMLITLTYFDPDGHYPIISEFELNSGSVYQFTADSFDFTGVVNYSCQFSDEEIAGTIRFSDNGIDLIEFELAPLVLVPPNVSVLITDDSLHLTWQAIENANSYLIYATQDITQADWGEPVAITNQLQYSEPLTGMRFYRIVASTDQLP